jgi:hypothetical protein
MITVVSLTPQKRLWKSCLKFQRCHKHGWNYFSSVIDTAETIKVLSLKPCKRFQRCQRHRGNDFRGVIDTSQFQWCHWHRTISALALTQLKFEYYQLFLRIRSRMRKGSCKDMLSFLRIRIPRFEPDREVNKWLPTKLTLRQSNGFL